MVFSILIQCESDACLVINIFQIIIINHTSKTNGQLNRTSQRSKLCTHLPLIIALKVKVQVGRVVLLTVCFASMFSLVLMYL